MKKENVKGDYGDAVERWRWSIIIHFRSWGGLEHRKIRNQWEGQEWGREPWRFEKEVRDQIGRFPLLDSPPFFQLRWTLICKHQVKSEGTPLIPIQSSPPATTGYAITSNGSTAKSRLFWRRIHFGNLFFLFGFFLFLNFFYMLFKILNFQNLIQTF